VEEHPLVTESTPRPLRTRPTVSVVIPCYNYGHFLADSVGSVLRQVEVDVDVLIVDDASPDGSASVAHALAASDPRVRVLVHDVNRGHIATYNEGLAAATGEYVVLLSADDVIAEGALARSTALLEAHPEVGLVYGFAPVFVDQLPPARTKTRSWSIWSGPEWLDVFCRRVSNPIYTPEVVMRTSLMRELKGYDPRLPHAADFLLWLRAATRASIARVNGVDQAFYRRHGSNMHMERYSGAVRDLSERYLAFEILFTDDAAHLPPSDDLLDKARRGMAREALMTACRAYEHGQAHVDTDAVAELEQLAALAEQIWPECRTTPLWRRYQRHVARARLGKAPVVPPRVVAFADHALVHVGWRRWRRSGLSSAMRSI
jgi:hypothetical protein